MERTSYKHHGQSGFTLVELLVVAAIIGILLAIAIPNLLKARISANEANAKKGLQTLRDAEGLFYEQDMDEDGLLDYTRLIGVGVTGSLRCPTAACPEVDSLVDSSFDDAEGSGSDVADCIASKAGYCYQFDDDVPSVGGIYYFDYGWQASMTSNRRNGRRDFSIYGDGVIRCTVSTSPSGELGIFETDQNSGACY